MASTVTGSPSQERLDRVVDLLRGVQEASERHPAGRRLRRPAPRSPADLRLLPEPRLAADLRMLPEPRVATLAEEVRPEAEQGP